MMRVLVIAFISVLCAHATLYAQLQHTHWFMGFGAGLRFTDTGLVATGGPLSTDEGCASIANAAGELLFFSNGETIWDRNGNVMPNGSGLLGHFSSTQSVLIVPVPGDDDRFEVFTSPSGAGTWAPTALGHHYQVDMTENGGLGDVVDGTPLVGPLTEKLSAVRHANGTDVWILYHGWNNANYYAYLLTCAGLEGPVVSTIGHSPGYDDTGTVEGYAGCMKLNAQGNRLASVWTRSTFASSTDYMSEVIVELLDFDDQTGQLSNLRSDTLGTATDLRSGYGVAFSPDGGLLYVTDNGLTNGIFSAQVVQYDLDLPFEDPVVVATGSPAFGSMQLGPDGSIYIARLNGATYLSRIGSPDLAGAACDFQSQAVSLNGDVSTWGLPNHWDTYPQESELDLIAFTDTLVCNGGSVTLEANYEHPFHVPAYLWSNGETGSSILATGPGLFTIEAQLPCTTLYDTVRVRHGGIPVELGSDVIICQDSTATIKAPDGGSILWSTGDTTRQILVEQAGRYVLWLTDTAGCITTDSIRVDTRNCACTMYLPNAFTPDRDGINDTWAPIMDCDPDRFELEVFDRWGALVYRSTDTRQVWRGEEAPVGVYAFRLAYSWDDGSTRQRRTRLGHISLLR